MKESFVPLADHLSYAFSGPLTGTDVTWDVNLKMAFTTASAVSGGLANHVSLTGGGTKTECDTGQISFSGTLQPPASR